MRLVETHFRHDEYFQLILGDLTRDITSPSFVNELCIVVRLGKTLTLLNSEIIPQISFFKAYGEMM